MDSANERQCYIVISPAIGWAHARNDRCRNVLHPNYVLMIPGVFFYIRDKLKQPWAQRKAGISNYIPHKCDLLMHALLSVNSLAPGGFDYSLKLVNFKIISTINIWSIFCEIAIRWMPQYLTDHWSTLVQVMAWCRQTTSHYLSQCWSRSLSTYDVTRPQWVNLCLLRYVQLLLLQL